MLKIAGFAALFAAAVALTLPASAKPPMEAFGDVADVRAMDISPDGKKLTYLNRIDGKDFLVVFDLETGKAKALTGVSNIRAESVFFVGNNYIVLKTSQTERFMGDTGRSEYTAAFSYNLSTNKVVQLLVNTPNLYPQQLGLGWIAGLDPDGKHVYMPAFTIGDWNPSLDLLRVDLETGRGESHPAYRGNFSTRKWMVDAKGQAVAREEWSETAQTHQIVSYANGKQTRIYTKETDLPLISVAGVSADGKSLMVTGIADSGFRSVYRMNLTDGAFEGPILERKGSEIDRVIADQNGVVYGVAYSGMQPSYDMDDKAVQRDVDGVLAAFPSSSVMLENWSADWSKILFYVSGGSMAECYVLLDRATHKVQTISRGRPSIKQEDVGEVITIEYKAVDGLKIPALITWPAGVPADKRKNLPLVVMPHGGPVAYDSISYDWLAQFIANEGYAVLQPNFRGSAGFGSDFRDAGFGEWGRKMQSDITDGVNAMIKMGWADPARVCIVGWSYGGYAALAGGAITPDLYKCVVSIAGVSNLREMLAQEKFEHGEKSQTVAWWKMLIGDPDKDREAIDAVSPARLVGNYKAPVLLIHGTDDLTVPTKQSDMMNSALTRANKNVEYVKITGDNHNMLDNDSRRAILTKLSEFLAKYLK